MKEEEITPLDELINFYDNVNPSVTFTAQEVVNELTKILPKAEPVKPVDVETDPYFIRQFDSNKYYWCKCENCGWEDSSEFTEGCHAIADTGDHSDPVCPICGCNKLEGDSAVDPDKQYEGIVEVKIPVALILSAHKKTIDHLNESLERFRYPAPVKPVDNGITVLINKINERIRLIPDEPNLSQRGALDAYLNVISWANDKAIENPTVRPLIQSGVPTEDIKTNLLIGLIEKARTYMGGWVFTQKELISDYKESVINSNSKQVKQPVMQWVKASERLPLNSGYYYVKVGIDKILWSRTRLITSYNILKNQGEDVNIEWLEEPPIQ